MVFSFICLALAATISSAAAASHSRHHSKRATAPANPIQVSSALLLCNVTSDLPVNRDLGFVGLINNVTIYTYGDTLSSTSNFYMTSDSSSIGTSNPCYVLNTQRTSDGQHPTDMVAPIAAYTEVNTADAFGGTNVIPTGSTTSNQGMMFFLKNHRPIGGNDYIKGAGLASVTVSSTKNITTSRISEYIWDATAGEPQYGDIGAYSDGRYIYGYGHGNSGSMLAYTYLTRAPIASWKTASAWQYYNGSTSSWTTKRLYNVTAPQALQWNSAEGPAYGVAQGQMIYSAYYGRIMWVYSVDWAENTEGLYGVFARTATTPSGPWSAAIRLYTVQRLTADSLVYCAVANPYYDTSGKSIVVTINNGAGVVQATKVVFK